MAAGDAVGEVATLRGRGREKLMSGHPFQDHFLEFSGCAG